MADFWKIVEVNTGICVPKYLKNVLMLYGYDDASLIESITMEDIDSIEEFVKSGIDEHVGDGEAKDLYHRFPNRKYQFIVTNGDRMKLMDVVEFVRNKLASEGGYKFFQQTLERTSSESLHSKELFIDNDDNQPIKTENNLNDRQLLVSSTTGVLENLHDNAIIAESLPTKQNRITSFSSDDSSDGVEDENLLVPLRFRTTTSHLSKENPIVVSPPNIRRCQVKIAKLNFDHYRPQIGNSSRVNKTTVAHKVKKDLQIPQTAEVDRESNIGDKTLRDENSVIQKFSCDICGNIFKSKGRIKQHMKFHTGVKLHVCSVCGYATTLNSILQRHLKIHTDEKPYVCDVCSKTFRLSSNLSRHKGIHTGERFACDVCPKTFSQYSHLSRHKRIHTGEEGNKPFVCKVCNKGFTQSSSLLVHKRIHAGIRFACDVCPKTFRQSSYLSVHKRIHSGKRFVCDVCSKTFNQSSNLLVHKRIHTGEAPFVCDVCSKAFRCSATLSDHKRIHTGEKPFVCDVCNKAFSQSSSLSVHKRIHAGEKPFVCDVCSKAFRSTSNLSEHKRIHTGARLVCDICPKTFSQSAHLSVHKRIHIGEKRCLP